MSNVKENLSNSDIIKVSCSIASSHGIENNEY
jgi:hypothetical protein